jgi:hypothetical protein
MNDSTGGQAKKRHAQETEVSIAGQPNLCADSRPRGKKIKNYQKA